MAHGPLHDLSMVPDAPCVMRAVAARTSHAAFVMCTSASVPLVITMQSAPSAAFQAPRWVTRFDPSLLGACSSGWMSTILYMLACFLTARRQ